ncbi:Plasminogen (Fragment) [Seminavis robusta]|uniref:Plasminogen n=1 Tax=Seminavis robusta TaxID=568900 RepID=A0A9N8DLP3_9STRA
MKISTSCLLALWGLAVSASASASASVATNPKVNQKKSINTAELAREKLERFQNGIRQKLETTVDTTSTVENEQNTNKLRRRDAAIDTRIIGGSRVKTPYPYMALLEVGCAAALIHDDILISAAHCNVGTIFDRISWIGSVKKEEGLVRTVVDIIEHPQFNDADIVYDFMIMKLNTTAKLDPYYRVPGSGVSVSVDNPAVTAQSKQAARNHTDLYETGIEPIMINRDPNVPQVGDPQQIMGFGVTSQSQFGLVDDLHENTVYAIDDADCGNYYQALGYFPNVMMCAGHPSGGADTCQGDSGGPMVDLNTNTLSGVTSWGQGCGLREYPGVYAQVDAVSDWIDEEICRNSCYPPDTCDPEITHPCADYVQGGAVHFDGPLEFTIEVTLDTYPSEFGSILSFYETGTELWFVPFGTYDNEQSPSDSLLVVEETFTDLPAGIYRLVLGDGGSDGLCCNYGRGGVTVTNSLGDELWSTDGRYGSLEVVYLNITDDGELVWAASNPDGTDSNPGNGNGGGPPSTFPGQGGGPPETPGGGTEGDDGFFLGGGAYDPSEYDNDWPGAFPLLTNSTNVVTINVRTDRFPGETEIQWSQRTGPDTFQLLDRENPIRGSTVISYEKFVENETIYRLRILDALGDGTCCLFGLGWFTITNATASDDFELGTVLWEMMGGEFFDLEEVFIWVDADGNSHLVEYLPGQGYALIVYDIVSEERIFVVSDEPEEPEEAPKSGQKGFGDWFLP